MAVLLLKSNLPHCPIWIAYSSQGFDIGANNLLWNLMDMTQIFFLEKTNMTILKFLLMKVFPVRQTQKSWNQQYSAILQSFDETFIIKYRYSEQIHFSDQVQPPAAEGCTSKSSRVFLNCHISQTGRNRQDKIFFWVATRSIFYKKYLVWTFCFMLKPVFYHSNLIKI